MVKEKIETTNANTHNLLIERGFLDGFAFKSHEQAFWEAKALTEDLPWEIMFRHIDGQQPGPVWNYWGKCVSHECNANEPGLKLEWSEKLHQQIKQLQDVDGLLNGSDPGSPSSDTTVKTRVVWPTSEDDDP